MSLYVSSDMFLELTLIAICENQKNVIFIMRFDMCFRMELLKKIKNLYSNCPEWDMLDPSNKAADLLNSKLFINTFPTSLITPIRKFLAFL